MAYLGCGDLCTTNCDWECTCTNEIIILAVRPVVTYSHRANSVCGLKGAWHGPTNLQKCSWRVSFHITSSMTGEVKEGRFPSLIVPWHLPCNGKSSQQTSDSRLTCQKQTILSILLSYYWWP